MNMTFIDFLVSAFGGTALVSIIVLASKTLIKAKIKGVIEHQYNAKLETHKANLDMSVNQFKQKLDLETESHKALLSKENEFKLAETQHKLSKDIELTKIYLSRYSEKQFEIYNSLWVSLVELKNIMQELWEIKATQAKADILYQRLSKCYNENERSALMIEQHHYCELRMILDIIKEFYFGKKALIEGRKHHKLQTYAEEVPFITYNGDLFHRFEDYYNKFQNCLRRQIQGINV